MPKRSRCPASLCTRVDFPHPSDPQNVINARRRILSFVRTAYPDATAKEGDWSTVNLAPIKSLRCPVALREIKGNPRLKGIPLVRQSRLSVMPLAESEFREIVKMSAR